MQAIPDNIEHYLYTLAVAGGASEAADFAYNTEWPDHGHLRLLLHLRPDRSDDFTRFRAISAFKEIVSPCIERGMDGIIEIAAPTPSDGIQLCLVHLMRRDTAVLGAAAFIVCCESHAIAEGAMIRIQETAERY